MWKTGPPPDIYGAPHPLRDAAPRHVSVARSFFSAIVPRCEGRLDVHRMDWVSSMIRDHFHVALGCVPPDNQVGCHTLPYRLQKSPRQPSRYPYYCWAFRPHKPSCSVVPRLCSRAGSSKRERKALFPKDSQRRGTRLYLLVAQEQGTRVYKSLRHRVSADVLGGRLECTTSELQSMMLVGTECPIVVGSP
jgi:hypothetical protein